MKPPIKGATEKELVEMMLTDKPSKMIWNVAIEEAAKIIEEQFDFLGEELLAAIEIRKLKK